MCLGFIWMLQLLKEQVDYVIPFYYYNLNGRVRFPSHHNIGNIIKIEPLPSKKNCVICFIESPLKMMKNDFYFILKALFVLEIFKFLS